MIEKEKRGIEEKEWKIRKWRDEIIMNEKRREKKIWKETVLIIKRTKKVGIEKEFRKKKDLEEWIKDKLIFGKEEDKDYKRF